MADTDHVWPVLGGTEEEHAAGPKRCGVRSPTYLILVTILFAVVTTEWVVWTNSVSRKSLALEVELSRLEQLNGTVKHGLAQIHKCDVEVGEILQQLERIVPRPAADVEQVRRVWVGGRRGPGDQVER